MEQRPIVLYAVCLEIKTSSAQLEKRQNFLSLYLSGLQTHPTVTPPFPLMLGMLMSPIIADNVENKWLERIHCHLISSLLQLGNLSFYVELLFTSIYA